MTLPPPPWPHSPLPLGGPGITQFFSNTSGRTACKYFRHGFGMPFVRQLHTACADSSQSCATLNVPPMASMICEAVASMGESLHESRPVYTARFTVRRLTVDWQYTVVYIDPMPSAVLAGDSK